jgi:hypothetical protein
MRNRAAAVGVREISQRNGQLLFFFEQSTPPSPAAVASSLREDTHRVLVNAVAGGPAAYIAGCGCPTSEAAWRPSAKLSPPPRGFEFSRESKAGAGFGARFAFFPVFAYIRAFFSIISVEIRKSL